MSGSAAQWQVSHCQCCGCGARKALKCFNTHRWSLSTYTLTHDIRQRRLIRAIYTHTWACGFHAYTTHTACVHVCRNVCSGALFLRIISSCLTFLEKKKHLRNTVLENNYTSPLFCLVKIFFFFFFSCRQQQKEKKKRKGKKEPHCSIVRIVSFFASEQRLFAAQLGTQWRSHKNEPLSSHTKLALQRRVSKFAYSHFHSVAAL